MSRGVCLLHARWMNTRVGGGLERKINGKEKEGEKGKLLSLSLKLC